MDKNCNFLAIFLQILRLNFYKFANKHKEMIQQKLRDLRKQRKISQEYMAKILSTDPSSYSRKENGRSKIYDDEWEKLAKALDVCVDDIKEPEFSGVVHHDNSSFNDNSENYYNQNFNIPNSVLESLQDYISLLKRDVELLKKENEILKSQK